MAIKTYQKNKNISLSKNFTTNEFDCHCSKYCNETLIDEKLVTILQKIRDYFNAPVYINSAYRCPGHNATIANAASKSKHMEGQAADINVQGVAPKAVAAYAETIGVLGIGMYDSDSDGHFVHIDTRNYKSFWLGHRQEKIDTFLETTKPTPVKPYYYRVRKTWKDATSQKGAYTDLNNAIARIKALGPMYSAYNEDGKIVYPEVDTTVKTFTKGTRVTITKGAKYSTGKVVPDWVINSPIYVHEVYENTNTAIALNTVDNNIGVVEAKDLKEYVAPAAPAPQEIVFNEGDRVRLKKGATYFNGKTIPSWVFNKILYVREKPRSNGDTVISTLKSGAITGVVNKKYLEKYTEATGLYAVRVTASLLNIRKTNSNTAPVIGQTRKDDIHEIYEVKGSWGRIKTGWIHLSYVVKV